MTNYSKDLIIFKQNKTKSYKLNLKTNKMKPNTLTTNNGDPIDNNQNSMTAGPNGPILL